MQKTGLLEAGKIVNTHGIRGEVRITTWTDTPEMLMAIENISIDGKSTKLISPRIHKSFIISYIEGVNDIDAAIKLKNKIICVKRDDLQLSQGQHLIVDLIGLKAIDADSGDDLGIVTDVLTLPKNNVYVIKGTREILVPAVSEFIQETNIEAGYIKFRLIEGL